jgi:hypothetical protein
MTKNLGVDTQSVGRTTISQGLESWTQGSRNRVAANVRVWAFRRQFGQGGSGDARIRRLSFNTSDVRAIEDGYMPERHFSVAPEVVACVCRYHDNVALFRDDVNTVNRANASSFLAAGVAMLRRPDALIKGCNALTISEP